MTGVQIRHIESQLRTRENVGTRGNGVSDGVLLLLSIGLHTRLGFGGSGVNAKFSQQSGVLSELVGRSVDYYRSILPTYSR